jgi:CHAT domain-containing protein
LKSRFPLAQIADLVYARPAGSVEGLIRLRKPRLRLISLLALLLACFRAEAEERFTAYEKDFGAAKQLILEGHVKDGIGQMAALLVKIDPTQEPNNYWFLSITLSDYLHQIASYQDEGTVLNQLASKKLHTKPFMFQQLALRVGRNLAFTGHANDAEKLLREATGGDARWVFTPSQREAARVLSQIELDRENVSQAAIWIRRAVVGALVDKGASSEEVVDTLTDYATYLRRTRQIFEAYDLLAKLIPVYDQTFSHRGPKYLHFAGELLESARSIGNLVAAENIYKVMKENADGVDISAPSVRAQLFYQDIYGLAARSTPEGNPELLDRLKKLAADFPDWIKQSDSRITFSYFSLLAGDLDQAEKYATPTPEKTENIRIGAYDQIIQSYIAARREDFARSTEMLSEALTKINAYHHEFANESPSKLPTISLEERAVLAGLLSHLAPNISSAQQADTVFRLEQFLNRDKAKLSLSTRIARLSANSDLQREDLRTRDRLKDLRERIMLESTRQLLSRTLPVKAYTPSSSNDVAFLTRLEQIEGKISTVDDAIHKSSPKLENLASENMLSLESAQRFLKPSEAIVSHVLLPGNGLAISCVTAERYQFAINKLSPSDLNQLLVDEKLVSAALRSINEPSPELDSSFPAESAFRLYRATLGPIEACLDRKLNILLATDADLFSIPWNALLTELDISKPFRHKTAAWVVRSHAISLLPSVGSLSQLRLNMPNTAATKNFLGIGDPNFNGQPDPSIQIALAPLVGTRGVGSREAIKQLPRLPEAGAELRSEARVLGAKTADLLLGTRATEREFRSKSLEDYKIISFATHALVAGEVDGFTEPALVLSPGDEEDNTKNDGLLTANEIADLTLDANLVILSACNTAGPDGRINSRGLSGLADAFFFAGARSLAVTQWAVYSDAAERIGSGLVSLSERERQLGVAEALRETALDFISSAKEDYMAHPRFWAAFIIAGDGSVAALADDLQQKSSNKIHIDHQTTFEPREQSELIDLTETKSKMNYAAGLAKPPPGEKRAGSYALRIGPGGSFSVFDFDREMAAARVFDFDDSVGLSGMYPPSCASCPQGAGRSAAVFKLLNRESQAQWKVIRESPNMRSGLDIVRASNGYILVGTETNYDSMSDHNSSLWLTVVSLDGKILREQQIPLPFILPTLAKGTTINAQGELVLAVNGEYPATEKQMVPPQINPLTGTKTYLCSSLASSLFLLIDPLNLTVRQQFETKEGSIARLRIADGHTYALMNVSNDCLVTSSIRLIEVDVPRQSMKTLYQTQTTNSVQAQDFEVTDDRFVMVGRVYVFLPPMLVRPTLSNEDLLASTKRDYLSDSIFDSYDFVMNAAILLISRDGTFIADKVVHDSRNRNLSALAIRANRRYVASGSALGDRGWIVEFSELTN